MGRDGKNAWLTNEKVKERKAGKGKRERTEEKKQPWEHPNFTWTHSQM